MHRAIYVLIVAFWLTMTTLLLRNETIREVPPSHVVKLILHHQQTSDLNIISNKLRLGHVRIDPKSKQPGYPKTIAFTGNLLFIIPGTDRQRIAWDGEVELDKSLAIQRFQIGVTMHDPDRLRSEITVIPAENIAHYELSTPKGVLERQTYTLDEAGAREVMQQLGIDPTMLPVAAPAQSAPPVVKAQQSSIEVHGESMDTYRVTVESNGQTWIEFHVDQLGHIVRATTLLGYSLVPDDILP